MASTADIMTSFQNLVQAVNGIAQTYDENQGTGNLTNITAATLVKGSPGRIVNVSVLVAGAVGAIYDVASASGGTAANKLYVIPATVGVFVVNMPVKYGLVVAPGAAQVVSVSYS